MFYDMEDITGIFMLALIRILASSVVATFAAVLQRLLQDAIDIKSENDLTYVLSILNKVASHSLVGYDYLK